MAVRFYSKVILPNFSLKTMYNKVEEEDQAILILKTDKDEVFAEI